MKPDALLLGVLVTTALALPANLNPRQDKSSLGKLYKIIYLPTIKEIETLSPNKPLYLDATAIKYDSRSTESDLALNKAIRLQGKATMVEYAGVTPEPAYEGGKIRGRAEEVAHIDAEYLVKRPNYPGGKIKGRAEEAAHTDAEYLVKRPEYEGGKIKGRAKEVAHIDAEHLVKRPNLDGGKLRRYAVEVTYTDAEPLVKRPITEGN